MLYLTGSEAFGLNGGVPNGRGVENVGCRGIS